MASRALPSTLGGLGVMGFLNVPRGPASLFPPKATPQRSSLESRASVAQKNLLWRQVATWPWLLPTAACSKSSRFFLQDRGKAGH